VRDGLTWLRPGQQPHDPCWGLVAPLA